MIIRCLCVKFFTLLWKTCCRRLRRRQRVCLYQDSINKKIGSAFRADQSLVRAKLAASAFGDASECSKCSSLDMTIDQSLLGPSICLGSDRRSVFAHISNLSLVEQLICLFSDQGSVYSLTKDGAFKMGQSLVRDTVKPVINALL